MSNAIVLADEKTKLFTALASFADALANLTEEQVPAAFEMADKMGKLSDEVRERLRTRILKAVKDNGQVVSEKGSMSLGVGGFKVSAIPTRTGVDSKKLEALLRARKLDPAVAMDVTMSYKANDTKILQAVSSGHLTADDVEAVKYDKAFRVMVERD